MKPLHLVWFLAGFQPRGWLDPRWDSRYDHRRAPLYLDSARELERGCLDGIVIADQQSIDNTFTGSIGPMLRSGNESLCGDPLPLLAMMGAVTSRLGLAATLSATFHPPFLLARQLNALDHLTEGRAGWNVVTGVRPLDGENYGRPLPPHDRRYDMADEHVELCKALWSSWEPDAVLFDRESGQFADPAKVHEVDYKGEYYSARGPLPMSASPQGHPVIVQAGGSGRGKEFAARHAEIILSNQNSTKGMREFVDDVQERAKKYERRPRILFSVQPVIGSTAEEARERQAALEALGGTEPYLNGGLAFSSMTTGIDLSRLDLDTPIFEQLDKVQRDDRGESMLFQYFKARPDTTPRDMGLAEAVKVTIPVAGTPEEVAERLCEIADETGADGFAIREALLPEYIGDIVDRLVPALQRRGAMRKEYSGTMFRDHVMEY